MGPEVVGGLAPHGSGDLPHHPVVGKRLGEGVGGELYQGKVSEDQWTNLWTTAANLHMKLAKAGSGR